MNDKIIKIFKDWGVENPENLLKWILPIIERYGEKQRKKGRSEIYKDIEKMKDNISMFPKI